VCSFCVPFLPGIFYLCTMCCCCLYGEKKIYAHAWVETWTARPYSQRLLKISYAGCLGLSPVISVKFTLEMCVAAPKREKFTIKLLFLEFKLVRGH